MLGLFQTMITFQHSGTLGDLIYSLYMVKKMGGGVYHVALNNIEHCVAQYGYRPEDVDVQHKGRFTIQDYKWLRPLLKNQSYISDVKPWIEGDQPCDVDLDKYRGVLYRTFEGNILEAYHRAFNLSFSEQDMQEPWLTADPIKSKPIIISRSMRYRPPNGDSGWREILKSLPDLMDHAIFVGTIAEHQNFVSTFDTAIEYRPVNDFLELAGLIAGSELVCGNQGFAYSLAVGLGKAAILEMNKIVPKPMNECYFPRDNIQYF